MHPPSGYAPATDTSIYDQRKSPRDDALGQRIAVQQTEQLPGGTVSSTTRVFSYDGDGQILGRTDGTVSGTGASATFTALSGSTTANPDAMAPQHYVDAEGHAIATLGESGTLQTSDGLTPVQRPAEQRLLHGAGGRHPAEHRPDGLRQCQPLVALPRRPKVRASS